MSKIPFKKYWWTNGKELLVFCFVIAPAFVGGAALVSGSWNRGFTISLVVVFVIWLAATIGDWLKWKRL